MTPTLRWCPACESNESSVDFVFGKICIELFLFPCENSESELIRTLCGLLSMGASYILSDTL